MGFLGVVGVVGGRLLGQLVCGSYPEVFTSWGYLHFSLGATRRAQTVIIISTSWRGTEDQERGAELGSDLTLVK